MNDVTRELALIQEINTAVGLAKLGLGALQRIDGANDFYHLPLSMLASGKERLLKVMLCIHSKEASGEYPAPVELKSHDLLEFMRRITDPSVFGPQWLSSTQAGREDHAFLTEDALYLEMLSVLSQFGQKGRYADLDVVLGKPQTDGSPQDRWTRMEVDLLSPEDIGRLGTPAGAEEARRKINRKVITHLERSFRALARWFTLGGGRPAGVKHSGVLMPFLKLMNKDLGTVQWPGV